MKVLVIAPHPDDEVLGCGGTIAKYTALGHEVYVCIVTKGCEPLFNVMSVQKVRGESIKADRFLGVKETIFLDYPAAMLETVERYKLNDSFVELIQKLCPDEVFIPHRGDMQIDHKMVVDAAMVALRPKYEHVPERVFAYETMSETGWDIPNAANEFIPNVYIDISDYLDRKLEAARVFESQIRPYPNARSLQALEVLARYRGCVMGIHAAEAFALVREFL